MKRVQLEHSNCDEKFPKVNFIGNKEVLASWICSNFPKDTKTVFDAFSGGGSISYFSKKMGLKVFSNDILTINHLITKALVENSKEILTDADVEIIFSGNPKKGFMYKNYANIYFFPEECEELDLYRINIEKLSSDYKKALALVLLRRAMIRKMPYSRFNIKWDKIKQLRDEKYSYEKYKRKRAYHNKSFKFHFLDNLHDYNNAVFDNQQDNASFNDDIYNLIGKVKADAIYLDPPYSGTMNNYFGFYGIFDEYVYSKKKQPFKNNFMDKNKSIKLFDQLFSKLSGYKYWILSYNNNSYPSKDDLMNLLNKYADEVEIIEKVHNYKITGKENKNKNREYLFIIKKKA